MLEILLAIDFNSIISDPISWLAYPFTNIFGWVFWPGMFTTSIIIAYIVAPARAKLGVTLQAILLTFGIFGATEYFLGAPEFSLIFATIAGLCLAGLVLTFLTSSNKF
jgi:hypothetical protein